MGLPRSKYVNEEQEGVYHCFNRCVRRAFLCGFDALTGRDFSHRKAWLVDRLRHLAAIFAIEVCAYAVLENHYHSRSPHPARHRRPLVGSGSGNPLADTLPPSSRQEAAPRFHLSKSKSAPLRIVPNASPSCAGACRSLSWFMGRLNEFIARAANKEDQVKGRFWESRFKCQALLDEAAIAACMVYVDLNPIRAGLAATPEESDFTSIQERIRAWHKETMSATVVAVDEAKDLQSDSSLSTRQHQKLPPKYPRFDASL